MDSETYWRERENEQLKHMITDEKEYEKELKRIYANMLDACQKEIDGFYGRYARKEGISLSEAKQRVSTADIAAYERKAAVYVKTKDFSDKANEEMRLYNTMMKVNRLEMLKANIGLELISGHDEIEKFMAGILQGRTEDELKRQAGILGKTIQNNAKAAHAIVNGSFHVAKVVNQSTFSDRIWQYQDLMRDDLGVLLQRGLIQGKNPRAIAADLRRYWYGKDPKTGGGAVYCMERLMRTELARVQTEAQKQSFEKNGFEKYIFIVNHNGGNCCPDCQRVADGGPYDVKKMMPGLNAPPMHPHCRCSTAAYEDDAAYEAWLDALANGENPETWDKFKGQQPKPLTREDIKKQIAENEQKAKDIIKQIHAADDDINLFNSTRFKDLQGLKKEDISAKLKAVNKEYADLDSVVDKWYNRPERGTDEYTEWREWKRALRDADPDYDPVGRQIKLAEQKVDLESKLRRFDEYEEWERWKKDNPLDKLQERRSKLLKQADDLDAEKILLKKKLSEMAIPSEWKKITVEHDSEYDIKHSNPNYSKGKEWKVNCQRCVPAYEMRRRGYDVIAKPNNAWGKSDYLSHNSNKAFENADVHWGLSGTGKRDIERLLKEWGEGARAEVGVSWKGANSGHVFVAENVGGKVVYIDPQSGEMDVSYYFKSVRSGVTRVWRIDNLNPSELIADCCEMRE